MGFEVEQKFRTEGHDRVAARLEALGARRVGTVGQEDAYWNHPARDFAASGEAFRLRRVGGRNLLTYKGPKRAGPAKTREEVEVGYDEGPEPLAAMRRLFGALGFVPVATVRKTRTTYELEFQGRPVEVALDEAEGLGTFVEVEVIAGSEADLPAAQAAVVALAADLGLSDLEPRSYLRMHLERQGSEAPPVRNSPGQT